MWQRKYQHVTAPFYHEITVCTSGVHKEKGNVPPSPSCNVAAWIWKYDLSLNLLCASCELCICQNYTSEVVISWHMFCMIQWFVMLHEISMIIGIRYIDKLSPFMTPNLHDEAWAIKLWIRINMLNENGIGPGNFVHFTSWFSKISKVAAAKITPGFQKWTKWQWQKVSKFAIFAMPLFVTLSISTPDFQKWTKWPVAKIGLHLF